LSKELLLFFYFLSLFLAQACSGNTLQGVPSRREADFTLG